MSRRKPAEGKHKDAVRHTASNCNQEFTFENFVVVPENGIAFASSIKMLKSKSSPSSSNPLIVYGGSGTGKTHLIQAAACEARRMRLGANVEYLTCEELFNQYIDWLKSTGNSSFRNRFRKVGFLLVDDIHFLSRAPKLQEEFFRTFDSLCDEGKKIILTSLKRTSNKDGSGVSLNSRFHSGIVVEIEPFGEESKFAILRKKQEKQLIKFNDKVLSFIAKNISADVRALEGALLRLIAFASLNDYDITVERAKTILRDYLGKENCDK